jgi:ketosteroid isomerase-like protein
MSFDPMAAAVDWLDAYRAGDVEAILDMCADDAVLYCECGSSKTLTGREALRAYWVDRLKRHPAFELEDLRLSRTEPVISYFTSDGVVKAVLTFNAAGQIRELSCGPAN